MPLPECISAACWFWVTVGSRFYLSHFQGYTDQDRQLKCYLVAAVAVLGANADVIAASQLAVSVRRGNGVGGTEERHIDYCSNRSVSK